MLRVRGHGREQEIVVQRDKKVVPNLIPKVQITIACNDAFEDITVDTIIRSGERGGQAI
jgi:nitrogen regulatory protein PII